MSSPAEPSSTSETSYAGQRLGLPRTGPGAVAGWGRRIAALVIDWLASLLVASLLAGRGVLASDDWRTWVPMLVFLLEASVFTALVGGSFGQLVVRIAVVRREGGPVSLLRALLRSLLICLVVPPLIFNRDQRGLHDIAADTVAVRR